MAKVFPKVKEQRFSHHSPPFLALQVSDCLSLQPFWATPRVSLSASSPNTVFCAEHLIVKGESSQIPNHPLEKGPFFPLEDC